MPTVVALGDTTAENPVVAGAKAANLARALRAGLPVLPGFVLTTAGGSVDDAVDAWTALTDGGRCPLVVRSSSTLEDTESSSMAGQFRSVLDVRGWPAFVAAVDGVRASARAGGAMAVLVQPQLDAACGGVLFGVDPVSGDPRRVAVEIVDGGPDALVSGRVTAHHVVVTRRGRVVAATGSRSVSRRRLHDLARLAFRAGSAFGGPQDVEWAVGRDGRLWLLQARPITARAAAPPRHAAVLGPGPVAETFPEPLHPLEVDLWVAPLRVGVAGAVLASGAASRRRVRSSPVVATVSGRVAADLDLLGVRRQRGLRWLLDPRRTRRVVAAWRIGRLRVALPAAAEALVDRVDEELSAVPLLRELDDRALVALLDRLRPLLTAVHGHEVLVGMLLDDPPGALPLPAVAMAAVTTGDPAWLALVPPRVGPRPTKPAVPETLAEGSLAARDALRLRARWLQELGAVAATALGGRLGLGVDVRDLTLDELRDHVLHGAPVPGTGERARRSELLDDTPLPAEFRLAPDGVPVALRPPGDAVTGLPAGGGRGSGPVHHGAVDDPPAPHDVLVVRTLDPRLAPVLPGLGGLVAETGSALSHLAILAREFRVPTVVGVPDALARYAEGATVVVDGSTGEVSLQEEVR